MKKELTIKQIEEYNEIAKRQIAQAIADFKNLTEAWIESVDIEFQNYENETSPRYDQVVSKVSIKISL